jgi:DNA-binding HxlR family transcriptional regulator
VPDEQKGPERPLPARRQWSPLGRALSVAGDNWTLMIAMQLAPGRTRLSHLRERLAGVSAGVLDRYLQRMSEAGLITRTRFREMPPRVEVELTDSGRELLPIASALSRWGVRRAWTAPREGEQIDIDALLRLLPSLVEEPLEVPDGTVAVVLDEPGEAQRHLVEINAGRARMGAGAANTQTPTSTITGDGEAWAAALGPAGDSTGLRLSGRRSQAQSLLAALPRPDDG